MDQTAEDTQPTAAATTPDNKKLFRFHTYCGRMGKLEGQFVLNEEEQAELEKLYGKEIHFGEVLGKHSDISITLKRSEITVVTDDQAFLGMAAKLRISLDSGFNPLDYVDGTYDEDDDAEEDDAEEEEV
jgi:hypothetical protein